MDSWVLASFYGESSCYERLRTGFREAVFICLGSVSRRRTGGSYGNSGSNCLRTCRPVSRSNCLIHSHPRGRRAPISPQRHQPRHLLVSVFMILAVLVGLRIHIVSHEAQLVGSRVVHSGPPLSQEGSDSLRTAPVKRPLGAPSPC